MLCSFVHVFYDLILWTFLNLWDRTRFENTLTLFSQVFSLSPCFLFLLVIPIPHLLGLFKLCDSSLKLCSIFFPHGFALYFKIWIIYVILLSFHPGTVCPANCSQPLSSWTPSSYLHLRWPLVVLSCGLGDSPSSNTLGQS